MKIWKKTVVFMGTLLLFAGCLGCGGENTKTKQTAGIRETEEKSTEKGGDENRRAAKLVWQGDEWFGKHGDYFNQVLKEKNLPYEVEFVREGEGVRQADLKSLTAVWKDTYDNTKEILAGEFTALDEWLDSEEGSVIKEAVPENVWDVYKVDGKQYTVLSVGFVPKKTVYIWNKKMAEAYDVHPENWSGKIWEYEADLKKICEGERETEDFAAVQGLAEYGEALENMTRILGVCYPFVINEEEEIPKAQVLYETPEYTEYLNGAQKLYDSKICKKEEEDPLKIQPFLKIVTDFVTEEAYSRSWQLPEGYWDTYEVKELWTEPLWRFSVCAQEVGILEESLQKKEAFELLCRLYEDAELTNALMWGEKGKDYEVFGNTAEAPVRRGYIPAQYLGNNFIAYAEVGQDENKRELYPKWLLECENSKIAGFEFSGKSCEKELEQIYSVYESGMPEENQKRILQYRKAGADRVTEEWNRQYLAWREGMEDGIKD